MFQAERGYKMGTVLLLKFTFLPISTSAYYYGLAFASLYTQNLVCELLWKLYDILFFYFTASHFYQALDCNFISVQHLLV